MEKSQFDVDWSPCKNIIVHPLVVKPTWVVNKISLPFFKIQVNRNLSYARFLYRLFLTYTWWTSGLFELLAIKWLLEWWCIIVVVCCIRCCSCIVFATGRYFAIFLHLWLHIDNWTMEFYSPFSLIVYLIASSLGHIQPHHHTDCIRKKAVRFDCSEEPSESTSKVKYSHPAFATNGILWIKSSSNANFMVSLLYSRSPFWFQSQVNLEGVLKWGALWLRHMEALGHQVTEIIIQAIQEIWWRLDRPRVSDMYLYTNLIFLGPFSSLALDFPQPDRIRDLASNQNPREPATWSHVQAQLLLKDVAAHL